MTEPAYPMSEVTSAMGRAVKQLEAAGISREERVLRLFIEKVVAELGTSPKWEASKPEGR